MTASDLGRMPLEARASLGGGLPVLVAIALLGIWPLAVSAANEPAPAPGTAAESDYAYRAQPHDTLIGLSRRLLKDPGQWPALQQRNAITRPTHIPLGTVILIPRDWLRQRPESATVTALVGHATIAGAPLKVGDSLPAGTRIATSADGYLTLTLADGSVITLSPGSSLELGSLRRYEGTGRRDTQLKLESGAVETRVRPQGDGGRFEIRTPVAISAVRGTEFRRAFDTAAALDRTEVVGGAVAVAGAHSDVLVPQGFGTISDAAGGPRAPVRLLAPPELSALPAVVEDDEVRFQFPPVAGATGYRARVAGDRDFRAIVAERVVDTPAVSIAALADGHYWLSLRSRDPQALEGADAVHEFERHRLVPPPEPGEPRDGAFVTGERAVFHWSRIDGAVSYHFQLARDAQFVEILADRERLAPSGGAGELTIESLEPGSYFWRVATVDAQGNAGRWSTPEQFRQKHAPSQIDPPRLKSDSIEFAWRGEAGQRFRFQVAHDPAFARLLDDHELDAPRESLPRPSAGTYYARVQATDPDGYVSPFTAARGFSVPMPWWARLAPLLIVIPFL